MFKKKPNIKNLAPLRSSDRRKVVDQIISEYELEVPKTDPAEGQTEEQAKASSLSSLRNALLPEGAQSARFTTTVGEDAHNASGTVYAAQFSGDELRIYWLKLEDKIVPTIYTLWRHPGLLPLLHTPEIVLKKMRGGADLMTPGLARGPPFPPKAKRGAIVAVAAYENPSVPIVVGACEIDVSSLTKVQGVKGHAVRGVQWEGDEIWSWSPGGGVGTPAPEHLEGWYDAEDVGSLTQDVGAVKIGGSEAQETDDTVKEPVAPGEQEPEGTAFEEVDRPKKEWTTTEIDAAFKNAFLYCLHDAKDKHRNEPGHGISFPVPQSNVVSHMINPYLPTFTPEDIAALQIKKTSWKNIRKFIKSLEKELLLKSKDRNGGETVILDIDFNDRHIGSFQPYRLPKKSGPTTGPPASGSSSAGTSGDDSIGQTIQIVHLLKPNKSLHPVLAAAKADPHALYLPTELRQHLTAYLEASGLILPTDKARAQLDPLLADALYPASTPGPADPAAQQAIAHGHVARDALLARAQSHACTAYHLIARTPAGAAAPAPATAAPRLDRRAAVAGPPPRVRLVLETRGGNKTATRVSGLEAFGVPAPPLAEALQKACASSTSVAPVVGSSPRKSMMEVMVQGPQREAVLAQLEKRGVSKAWVEVTDKTKKKGGR